MTQTAAFRQRPWDVVYNVFGLDTAQVGHLLGLNLKCVSFDHRVPESITAFLDEDTEGFEIVVCPPATVGMRPDVVRNMMQSADGKRHLRALGCPNDSVSHLGSILSEGLVPILNVPDVHRRAVAEYTLLEFGCAARKLSEFAATTGNAGHFPHDEACVATKLLYGKTVGVIGATGKDGSAVAELAVALSMNVMAYARSAVDEKRKIKEVQYVDSLDELLRRSDFLSLNVRLNSGTRGLISAHEIAQMKRGVVIVNPAGAELIDATDIEREMSTDWDKRRVSSLVLDMPYGGRRDASGFLADPVNARLRSLGVTFTPRMAGYALDVVEASNEELCVRIEEFLAPPDQGTRLSVIGHGGEGRVENLPSVLCEAVQSAGRLALSMQEQGLLFGYKQDGSPVSRVDELSEKCIKDVLAQAGYEFTFRGEETWGGSDTSSMVVIADGIDGTRNFRDGNFGWCVSAIIRLNETDLCSAVYDPVTDTLYSAVFGGGAFVTKPQLGRRPLVVPSSLPSDFSFSIGSFFLKESRQVKHEIVEAIKLIGGRGREWGSVALSVVSVARGGLGVFIQGHSHVYDHAAALLIAKEAGASVFSEEKKEGVEDVIVCHPSLFDQVLKIYAASQ